MGKIVENKKNGQLNVNIKKSELKKLGISHKDLFNSEINIKRLMIED